MLDPVQDSQVTNTAQQKGTGQVVPQTGEFQEVPIQNEIINLGTSLKVRPGTLTHFTFAERLQLFPSANIWSSASRRTLVFCSFVN